MPDRAALPTIPLQRNDSNFDIRCTRRMSLGEVERDLRCVISGPIVHHENLDAIGVASGLDQILYGLVDHGRQTIALIEGRNHDRECKCGCFTKAEEWLRFI